MAAGRMSHRDHAIRVQFMLIRDLRKMRSAGADVIEGSGPSAARVAETPILQAPGGDALACERLAHVSEMRQVIFGSPIATVDHDCRGMRSVASRRAQLAELKLVRAVGDAFS